MVLLASMAVAGAQGIPMPTDKQLEDARRKLQAEIPAATDRIDRAAPRPSGLLRDPPPAPSGASMVDIEKLVTQQQRASRDAARSANEGIYVFVSLSLPRESLVRVGRDARRAGATLVLRGMPHGVGPGNWTRSLEAMKPITDTGAELQIHPDLFKQYGIKTVPTFVVATAAPTCDSEDRCAGPSGTVVGDVSLDYALDRLADRRDRVGEIARGALKRMGLAP